MPSFIGLKDVAERLELSEPTVRKLFQRRELPATKLGGQWFANWDLIEQTILQRCIASTDAPEAPTGKSRSPVTVSPSADRPADVPRLKLRSLPRPGSAT